ncbi:esterase-like activity of phytase family protein [Pseudoroseicyclus aestuarii]|uniref:Phytase-like domain-containing protein n=1 Tax=Pseudoroseicyclus aestuarii TaxID=1795041 RepID=A0A318SVB5_9RHOB|nr:esterase-like activity of phytase family protein [Pseudoroseicyclus aestuarii]PYE84299.1 hypothetical protein DFP88_10294 [Pseudoroseicyclus aestuarii]
MRRWILAAALLAAAPVWAQDAGRAEVFAWRDAPEGTGGFSGIEVTDDGAGFLVLSDRTYLLRGSFTRDEAGRVTGATTEERLPLRGPGGAALPGGRGDSEGLALDAEGGIWISFEGPARVQRGIGPPGETEVLPSPREFAGMGRNAALEALAIGPNGAIYTIPERAGRADQPFPVFRYTDGGWTIPFSLPRIGNFAISGADIGPDGRLYVLERDFVGIGFRSRVRRMALDGTSAEVLIESGIRQFDNLEGISVWRDDAGDLRLTMISDDNLNPLQQTQIVELTVPEAGQGPAPQR